MKILDLIKQTEFDKIFNILEEIENDSFNDSFRNNLLEYYNKLFLIKENKSLDNLYFVVSHIYKYGRDEREYIGYSIKKDELLSCLEKNIPITVWGGRNNVEHYCIDFCTDEEIVNLKIAPSTLKFDPNLILALIFSENIWWGFSDEEKKENEKSLFKELNESLQEIISDSRPCRKTSFCKYKSSVQNIIEKEISKSHKIVIEDVLSIANDI